MKLWTWTEAIPGYAGILSRAPKEGSEFDDSGYAFQGMCIGGCVGFDTMEEAIQDLCKPHWHRQISKNIRRSQKEEDQE